MAGTKTPSSSRCILQDVVLAPRKPIVHEGEPAVSFTQIELAKAESLFRTTMILKFCNGMPKIQ